MDDEEIEVNAIVEEEEVATEAQVDALKGDKGDTGPQGIQGEPGYTPVKGVDYFTEQDKQELLSGVEEDIAELDRDKADKTEIPDVSSFITKDVNNLTHYTLKTATGSLIDLEINQSTYVVTLSLKDIDGNVISTDTIDLPLESVVIGGTFDKVNKKIVLTLENGNTVDIPVGDLVAGLQTEITSSNKLASDLVDDTNSGNKFVTTSEKTAWNAKLDESDLADYVKNTDYATAGKGGVILIDGSKGTSINTAGKLQASVRTYAQYGSDSSNTFIGKGTLENVITGKELINQTTLDDSQAEQNTDIQANTDNITALLEKIDYIEGLIPTGEASGESLTLSNTARYPFKEFNVEGNTKQATAILPDEYQQVDYIESSGTQYIDTGITGEAQWNLRVQGNRIYQGTQIILSRASNAGYWFGIIDQSSGGQYGFGTNNKSSVLGTTLVNAIINASNTNISGSVNNVNITERAITNSDYINNSYWLLNANASSSSTFFAEVKLHYAKCYQNNVLVRNFIPCYRKSDNVVGLYDLVNKVFYTNAGTGAFTYGAVVTLPNPDFPIEVENVSGEVEVKVENKNIYNSSLAVNNMYQNYNNPYWSMSPNNSYWCIGLQKIKPNTNYTISRTPNITVCYDKDRNPIPQGLRGATITTQATAYYMNCCYVKNSFPFGSNLQIEEGSTATSYEPHEEQTATFPLATGQVLHIGDTLEDDGIHITRGQQTYNGTEAGIGYNDTQQVFSVPYNVNKYKTYNVALCNQYQYTTKYTANLNNYEFTTTAGNGKYLFIKDTRYNTVDDYKAYLVEQYNNGTPLIAQLELITPTVIPYTAEQQTAYNNLKNLYSYKGTTYISSSNEPSPVFEVVYRKELESIANS